MCGNIVEYVVENNPVIECCGQQMKELVANTDDSASREKHVPVFKKENEFLMVWVGETAHPSA